VALQNTYALSMSIWLNYGGFGTPMLSHLHFCSNHHCHLFWLRTSFYVFHIVS